MRVVVAITPGHGHLNPTLPLAGAFAERGHHVVYAMVGVPALRARVEAEGHAFVSIPPVLAEQRELVARGLRDDPSLAGIFGSLAPPAVGSLVRLIEETEARLVVHDMASFAAPLAAEVAGVGALHRGRCGDQRGARGRRLPRRRTSPPRRARGDGDTARDGRPR